MRYVIARAANNRPSLIHLTVDNENTLCGRDMYGWSRAFFKTLNPTLVIMFCKHCKKIGGLV